MKRLLQFFTLLALALVGGGTNDVGGDQDHFKPRF